MPLRLAKLLLLAAALTGFFATTASARSPVTSQGPGAQLVARYVAEPTAFAFSPQHVFMSDGTVDPLGLGGVYVLARGTVRRLPHSPAYAFGLAWHDRTLYISAGTEILAWRDYTGRGFTRRRIIYTAPPGFTGFNGLAFGPNGRLYVGVSVGAHKNRPTPYHYDVLSMTRFGANVKIVARGIRQPWQLAFPTGSPSPFVTDLGRESGGAPDLLLRVRARQDYGFPTCNWSTPAACQGFSSPFHSFAGRSDPMGLAIAGQRLYISEFGVSRPAQVISIPVTGGPSRTELSGFGPNRHIVGLGANDGWIYVGEIAQGKRHFGSVWRFRAR